MPDPVVLWRRLDVPGHETCRLTDSGPDRRLEGTAVFAHEGQPCRLDYQIVCDADWQTTLARVSGWVGDRAIEIDITADAGRTWRLNGAVVPAAAGCTDVDLNFSPSTNTLPIRRLGPAVGGAADVRAAWLRFPSFQLEPLDQVYRRIDSLTYRYESAGGSFTADLRVNAAGLVTDYAVWQLETGA
jgi:hypothetical protein